MTRASAIVLTLLLLKAGAARAETGLTLRVDAPATDVPLSYLVHLDTSTLPLPALTSEFLRGEDSTRVPADGVLTVSPLPPGTTLELRVFETGSHSTIKESVVLRPEGMTELRVDAGRMKIFSRPTVDVGGRVLLEDGSPVAGAAVVWSSYPARRESTTGRDGSFFFRSVPAGRRSKIFVDARASGLPEGYPVTKLFGRIKPKADLVLTIWKDPPFGPAPPGLSTPDHVAGHNDTVPGGRWEKFKRIDVDSSRNLLRVLISTPAAYTFYWEKSLLNYYVGGSNSTGTVIVPMTPLAQQNAYSFTIYNNSGVAARGVGVQLVNFIPDIDPYSTIAGTTSANAGQIQFPSNRIPQWIWIDDPIWGCALGPVAGNLRKVILNPPGTCLD